MALRLPRDLKQEIEILQRVLEPSTISARPQRGASAAQIQKIEKATGIRFAPSLKAMWSWSNGSGRETWFAVRSDEPVPCSFLSLSEGLEHWKLMSRVGQQWHDEGFVPHNKPDRRIRPGWLRHPKWFPIGDFNGGSTAILFDAAPTARGTYGQILVYQHDPDGIYYVADSFIEFLKLSNRRLRKRIRENADDMLE